MPRRARIHHVSLRSSLVNLPISIYGPLLERNIRPQNLAVHLGLSDAQKPVEVYVGWTGMASASSLAHFNADASATDKGLETVEIDPQFATSVGFPQGVIVDIGLLHDLPTAKSVSAEPVGADDWEIIELHAAHVESTLLSQVRVACVGQEIDVWVHGRTRVRLQVVSLDPPPKSPRSTAALLLTTNTEISVAPKPQLRHPAKPKALARPSTEDQGQVKPKKSPSLVLRLLPSRVIENSREQANAYVSAYTFALLTSHPYPLPTPASTDLYEAIVKRLPPPPDPTGTLPPAPLASNTNRENGALSLNAGSKLSEGKHKDVTTRSELTEDGGRSKQTVILGWSASIPDQHVVFVPVNNRYRVEGLEEYDLVRLNVAGIHRSSSARLPVSRSSSPSEPMPAVELTGISSVLDQAEAWCLNTFIIHQTQDRVHGLSSLLITARAGFGKTSIVKEVARRLSDDSRIYAYPYYVDVSRHAQAPIQTLKGLFRYWLEKAQWHRPTILILDNLDKLLSVEVEHADSFRSRHLTELFLALFSRSSRPGPSNTKNILLLATAESNATLHPRLNNSHLFGETITVKAPSKESRREILESIITNRLSCAPDITQDPERPLNFTALATQTEGYSPVDLHDLVSRAVHQSVIRASKARSNTKTVYLAPPLDKEDVEVTLIPEDFATAQVDFTPISLRDVPLQKSDVAWTDIGGLRETRRVLRETIEWPTKYGPIFAQSPLRLRSGLLLYGYPGCGKTMLASAVARECGLNFISVKGPEILNKYIGASEKSVRDLFDRASAARPCVLFFDEFDSIAPKRGHDSTGVTDRVVNQMLTQLDGVEGLEGVYVLAATSRPDLIDSALLRPGRLDKSLLCDMPDAEERKEILEAVSRKVLLAPSVDLGRIAETTEGFSGADLQALIYNAHLDVIHSTISSAEDTDGVTNVAAEEPKVDYVSLGGDRDEPAMTKAEERALHRRLAQIISNSTPRRVESRSTVQESVRHEIQPYHLERVLKSTRPSVSLEERARLLRIYHAFQSDRSGEMPLPPEESGVGQRVSLM